jgi:hypothetical protein
LSRQRKEQRRQTRQRRSSASQQPISSRSCPGSSSAPLDELRGIEIVEVDSEMNASEGRRRRAQRRQRRAAAAAAVTAPAQDTAADTARVKQERPGGFLGRFFSCCSAAPD